MRLEGLSISNGQYGERLGYLVDRLVDIVPSSEVHISHPSTYVDRGVFIILDKLAEGVE